MAKLDECTLEKLRTAVQRCEKPWILAAYQREEGQTLAASLEGTIGFLDWRLHGQVSRLLKRQLMRRGTLTPVPSRRHLGKASLLVYFAEGREDDSDDVLGALKKLHAKELCLAEDTFPAALATKLKKSFSKAGIRWDALGEAL